MPPDPPYRVQAMQTCPHILAYTLTVFSPPPPYFYLAVSSPENMYKCTPVWLVQFQGCKTYGYTVISS